MDYGDDYDYEGFAKLLDSMGNEQAAAEIGVLQSIYGEQAVKLWTDEQRDLQDRIRYKVTLLLPDPYEDTSIAVLVSLHRDSYPEDRPQLQLLSRFIGPFGIDGAHGDELFGRILRLYFSQDGVPFMSGEVCVFDGLEKVKELCASWLGDQLSLKKAQGLAREETRPVELLAGSSREFQSTQDLREQSPASLPPNIELFQAGPIIDRKSVFVGRACRITLPSEVCGIPILKPSLVNLMVPLIIRYLLSDRRIARAHHPVINAWRCRVDGLLYQDNDDDGETAAGNRLAHLLKILDLDNVLIIVTRHYGGIQLGPDRFKHINQAARNALDQGGFLESVDKEKLGGGKRSSRKKH